MTKIFVVMDIIDSWSGEISLYSVYRIMDGARKALSESVDLRAYDAFKNETAMTEEDWYDAGIDACWTDYRGRIDYELFQYLFYKAIREVDLED